MIIKWVSYLARLITCDLFLAVDNPYSVNDGLTFSLETIATFHKENQTMLGPATVMSYYNSDLVKLFFQRLEAKLAATLQRDASKCQGQPVKVESPETGH